MKKRNVQANLKFFISILFLYTSISLHSQDGGIVIDKIIAKVDDYIVLKSDLETAYLDFLSRGELRSSNAKCDILQDLVINKMLVAQSIIDSVMVGDDEVNGNLDRRMQVMTQQFGSEEQIESTYGKSIEQIRSEIFENIKEQLIIQKMQSELTSSIKVTPSEVRRFFKNIPQDSLPYFSTEVAVAQIVIEPKAGKEEKDKVYNKLLEIKTRVENGESFGVLAREYSEDPGSARLGGQLPFYGRGQLAPEYEATALSLDPGELSMPVESQFGFHLIELQERRGNTYKTRHILITAKPNEKDIQVAYRKIDSLRTLAMSDSVDFRGLAKEHSEDQETSSAGGFFQDPSGALRVSSEQLDPTVFFTIDTMKVGTISKPQEFSQRDGSMAYRILYYKDKMRPHIANLNDDYQKISRAALNKKQNIRISQWFEQARSNVFIEVDPEYSYCNITTN